MRQKITLEEALENLVEYAESVSGITSAAIYESLRDSVESKDYFWGVTGCTILTKHGYLKTHRITRWPRPGDYKPVQMLYYSYTEKFLEYYKFKRVL
jgi:hypothetical protein